MNDLAEVFVDSIAKATTHGIDKVIYTQVPLLEGSGDEQWGEEEKFAFLEFYDSDIEITILIGDRIAREVSGKGEGQRDGKQ